MAHRCGIGREELSVVCHSRLAPSARDGHDRAVVSLPVCGAFVGRAAELAALQDAYRDPAV
ncbi:hypothetical protein, partial [Nocardia abscessus]|uniref:hypothetical protein n=1 Tax=Nocardia abscessus TaxID=120957 RepID=UPI0024583326